MKFNLNFTNYFILERFLTGFIKTKDNQTMKISRNFRRQIKSESMKNEKMRDFQEINI